MKRKIIIDILAICIVIVVGGLLGYFGYRYGHNSGYDAGYDAGISDGWAKGFASGKATPSPTPGQKDIVFKTQVQSVNPAGVTIDLATVTNTSSRSITNVYVESTWFDTSGNKTASINTNINNLLCNP